MLADAIYRFDIDEWGAQVWDVVDADSCGLEGAWAFVADEKGRFRDGDYESLCDPVVYVYRYALHPDFAEWRMPVMDAF